MYTNTVNFYMKIDPSSLSRVETWENLTSVAEKWLQKLEGDVVTVPMGGQYGKLLVYKGCHDSHATFRVFDDGLITVDVNYCLTEKAMQTIDMENRDRVNKVFYSGVDPQLAEELIRKIEQDTKNIMGEACLELNSLYAPIKRGQNVWPYALTADERILEMDYDELVVDEQTRWQQVRIMHSKQYGNVLLLDGDLMLGESDLIYTQTVCGIGYNDFTDKEILILGGGDGGILYELLKEKPKFIDMAEIDEVVIQSCRKHMRSVCGDAMDNYEGPHHKIHITDCVNFLHTCIQNGKKFDYVINDLTEFPVDKAARGFSYDFETTSLITEMSVKAVKHGGKVLARGNCLSAYEYRQKFENDVETMGCDYLRREKAVPSFEEVYCFYEIWRKGEVNPPPQIERCSHCKK